MTTYLFLDTTTGTHTGYLEPPTPNGDAYLIPDAGPRLFHRHKVGVLTSTTAATRYVYADTLDLDQAVRALRDYLLHEWVTAKPDWQKPAAEVLL